MKLGFRPRYFVFPSLAVDLETRRFGLCLLMFDVLIHGRDPRVEDGSERLGVEGIRYFSTSGRPVS
jgi:hypothetical protein